MRPYRSGVDALSLDEDFNGELAKAAAKIKRAARGRVCRDCKHLREGWCAEKTNISGSALRVIYPTAAACGQHAVR